MRGHRAREVRTRAGDARHHLLPKPVSIERRKHAGDRLLAVIAAAREFGSAPGSQEENIQRTADIRRARHTLGDANLGDERPSLVRQGAHMKATQPVAQDPALSAPMLVFGLSSHPFALFEPSPRLAQVNTAPDGLLHTSA